MVLQPAGVHCGDPNAATVNAVDANGAFVGSVCSAARAAIGVVGNTTGGGSEGTAQVDDGVGGGGITGYWSLTEPPLVQAASSARQPAVTAGATSHRRMARGRHARRLGARPALRICLACRRERRRDTVNLRSSTTPNVGWPVQDETKSSASRRFRPKPVTLCRGAAPASSRWGRYAYLADLAAGSFVNGTHVPSAPSGCVDGSLVSQWPADGTNEATSLTPAVPRVLKRRRWSPLIKCYAVAAWLH